MSDLGGYFGYENFPEGDGIDPGRGIRFASGRQALIPWLIARRVGQLWLPGWTCPSVLDAAEAAGVRVVFYHLGRDLSPESLPSPAARDALLLLNPCGLLHDDLELADWTDHRVIVDDTMAFFRGPRVACPSFNSWRKFLPVPDGATLHDPGLKQPVLVPHKGDEGFLQLRAEGGAAAGHEAFQTHEEAVGGWPTAGPSGITMEIMARLDGALVRRRRRANFAALHAALAGANALELPPLHPDAVPLAYPFLPAAGDAHQALWDQQVWVPRLWGDDSRLDLSAWERRLAVELLPLPVDHRYDEADMARLVALVRKVTA